MPGDGRKPAGLSVASLVLGIVSFVVCWIPHLNVVVWITALLAVVFGVMGRRRAAAGIGGGAGMATAGMVLGIVWLALFLIVVVLMGMILGMGMWAANQSTPIFQQLNQQLQQQQRNVPPTNPSGLFHMHLNGIWGMLQLAMNWAGGLF